MQRELVVGLLDASRQRDQAQVQFLQVPAAAEQMLWLMQEHVGMSADDAYSLASVAIDLGITQVVDGTLGCHAAIARSMFV